ncbi:hypothetical protein HYH02_015011 [Chlamydomonas schloesseri]|uniref:Uncharacterized protein n=1 Tax=Chlamydomonas schloesseri TaxID=2026947 RepID=A0A835STD1_9CHLO|nr:hypothetical protein HYH02_015011 [Chlamydomonas schloesseri]|eukprot:KAG2425526.1 hypothetical protein HYH02_015011 [Chlamydomonas schloesseri]
MRGSGAGEGVRARSAGARAGHRYGRQGRLKPAQSRHWAVGCGVAGAHTSGLHGSLGASRSGKPRTLHDAYQQR